MSKSLGNFVDLDAIERYVAHYGLDGFRYFLLAEGPIAGQDANFASARVQEVYGHRPSEHARELAEPHDGDGEQVLRGGYRALGSCGNRGR